MWVESVGLGKSLGVVSVELWSDMILGLAGELIHVYRFAQAP